MDASGRFDVIRFRNRVQKAFAITLELHRPNSANLLKGAQRAGTTHSKLRQGSIREYNIWRHVFLAGDRCANCLEVGEQALRLVAERQIVGEIGSGRPCSRGTPVTDGLGTLFAPATFCSGRMWLLWLSRGPDGRNAQAIVATLAAGAGTRIAEVSKHESAPALLCICVALDSLKLG